MERIFSRIYHNEVWDHGGGSGPGSHPDYNQHFITYIQHILSNPKLNIKSVLDLGCGDWQYAQHIGYHQYPHVKYLRIDTVSSVIKNNTQKYAK